MDDIAEKKADHALVVGNVRLELFATYGGLFNVLVKTHDGVLLAKTIVSAMALFLESDAALHFAEKQATIRGRR